LQGSGSRRGGLLQIVVLLVRFGLAAMFATAAFAKLANPRRTAARMRLFRVPEAAAWPLSIAVPVVELAAVILLVPSVTARAGGVLTAAIMLVFAGAVARLIVRREAPDCNCFGVLLKSRVGPAMLVRNLVLAGLGAFVAVAAPADADGVPLWPWVIVVVATGVVVAVAARRRERRAAAHTPGPSAVRTDSTINGG
jgi:hypothetical protein